MLICSGIGLVSDTSPLVASVLILITFLSTNGLSDVIDSNNETIIIRSTFNNVPSRPTETCYPVSPCQNNATCQSVPPSSPTTSTNPQDLFKCSCVTGWTGRLCDVDINECADSVKLCQNDAMCKNLPGTFQCYCIPGYLGDFCEQEADECLTEPCKNGATCLDKLNGFDCTCPLGYIGKQCEKDVDECESAPCLNGARCNDLIGAYKCSCVPGFIGTNCETNVDDCEINPCKNGGRCLDGINNFTCNCVNTGYHGRLCDVEVDECASIPCQNNGSCTDIGRDYKCQCFDGYMGKNCEVDINECMEPFPPCQNGATCIERSNVSLRLDQNLLGLKRAWSYANSAGYDCRCLPGYKGKKCEVEINECESSPCRHGICTDLINGFNCTCLPGWEGDHCERDINECLLYDPCSQHGICENNDGGFSCKCAAEFGGRNCSVALTGCLDLDGSCAPGLKCPVYSKCAEGATCSPFLVAEEPVPVHNFSCLCPAGRAGRYCQSSSVAYFAADGFLQLVNQTLTNASMDFRTTLNESLLMVAFINTTSSVAIQIAKGRIEVVANERGSTKSVTFNKAVSDGKWYSLAVVVEKTLFTAILVNTESLPLAVLEKQTLVLMSSLKADEPFSEVFFGGLEHRVRLQGISFRLNMVGCMRDITINREVLIPAEMNSMTRRRQPSVRTTCDRKEQCSVNTCNRRGRCSDLWNRYECACDRPYYGLSCEKEIPAGTFNNEKLHSSVSLNLNKTDKEALELQSDISFRIRTLENNTVIFYLGSLDGNNFMVLRLVDGNLLLDVKLSPTMETVHGPTAYLNDGNFYFVEVQRDQTMVQIKVDNYQPTFSPLAAGSPLHAEVLLLGRTIQPRLKRQNNELGAAGNFGSFKGVLQDFRLNGKLVPFFPMPDSGQVERLPPVFKEVVAQDVLKGVVSDNTCASSPCENGGSCEVTWNDFKCTCPVAFRGKVCNLPNFCLANECPSQFAQCKKLENDYECLVNISLLEPGAYITYTPTKIPSSFRKVSFRFRTRSLESTNILSVTSSRHNLKIYIKNARIEIEYRLGPTPSIVTIDRPINDAQWHSFEAEFLDLTMNIALDEQRFAQDVAHSDVALNKVLLEDNAYVQLGGDFIGCLDDVRLGTHLLPVFPEAPTRSPVGLGRILKIEKRNGVDYGCRGQAVCQANPCQYGRCVDLWNSRRCDCDPAVDGPGCGNNIRMDHRVDPPCGSQIVCYNGGTMICEETFNSTKIRNATFAPHCICVGDFSGPQCETGLAVIASPGPDQLGIILGVTLSVAGVLVLIALTAFCITARRKRAERGTYSPSRQEMFGSRVEMGYVLKPPPQERLI